MFDETSLLITDIQSQVKTWESEETKWTSASLQIYEIQKYGVAKFLTEKPLKTVVESLLFTGKHNIDWRNATLKIGCIEFIKWEKELKEICQNLVTELRHIHTTYVWGDGQVEKSMNMVVKKICDVVNEVKKNAAPTTTYFTKVARVEFVLYIYAGQLPNYVDEIKNIQLEVEAWKQRMTSVKVPSVPSLQEFIAAYKEWKATLNVNAEDGVTQGSPMPS